MKRSRSRLRFSSLWFLFGPILTCMWLGAVNYSNNLVYAVLYLVGALSFISVFHAWRNLSSVEVEHVRIYPAFAGDLIEVEVFLRNSSRWATYGIFFFQEDPEAPRRFRRVPIHLRDGQGLHLAGEDSLSGKGTIPGRRRGVYRFDSLIVQSSYPFGLFLTTMRVPVAAIHYVYPKAQGKTPWPAFRPGGEQGAPFSTRPGDDFSGVRAYAPGESLRHIDWKAYARGRPLSVKLFTGGEGRELWLDAKDLAAWPMEDRLSQLCLWVINAEKEEIPYGLRLGRTNLPVGLGQAHATKALQALATGGTTPSVVET